MPDHPRPPPQRALAVLIATRNRESELANRALASVLRQTRAPDLLVIVDDSDHRHREANERIVQGVERRTDARTRVRYARNDRTPGASGAWNVGLDWLHREIEAVDDVMVAILDDDDAWEPDYLAACHAAAVDGDLDMVAADVVRHEATGDIACRAPEGLDSRDFLVSNPGIQGSNLFVKLGTLLAAGLFDEALSSCTDRDLCMRIAALGTTRYARLPRVLVHHHADADRLRLSTPGSGEKQRGLDAFFRKYRHRMSAADRAQFCERAERLFAWRPAPPAVRTASPRGRVPVPDASARAISLVIGMVTASVAGPRFAALLDDLAALRADHRVARLQIIALENGPRGDDGGSVLRALADRARERDVDMTVVPIEQQARDAANGRFGEAFERPRRVSIATGRTMLQIYVYEQARARPDAIAWILDDDARLSNLVWNGGDRVEAAPLDVVSVLARLREIPDLAVAIGTCTDAPPLPFASCARTQLVDAWHNFEILAALDPEEPFPELLAENMAARAQFKDYYYDLSRRETDHLETPFWYVPATAGRTARQVFREIAARLPRILAGEQIFRPLVHDATIDPVDQLQPSVHRGGNTFVFDIEALRDFPNGVPTVGGIHTRRSDMVWALLNQHCARRRVEKLPLPVRQDRSDVPPGTLDLEKLATDIQGYALYSALDDVLAERAARGRRGEEIDPRSLELDEVDISLGVDRMRKYLRERVFAFQLGFHRAAGLVRTLGRFCDPASACWWLREGSGEVTAVRQLRDAIALFREEYALERLPEFRDRVLRLDERLFRRWIEMLRRETSARASRRSSRPSVALAGHRVLGGGAEGLVVTDEKWVYKLLSASRIGRERIDFLKAQRWEGCRTLYPLRHVRAIASSLVVVYPYEPSSPYRGGRGDELRLLLDECKARRVVFTNVHPDNLIVTASGLKFIDYGADVEPWTEAGGERMARRVFLSGRYWRKRDLKVLLRRSIDDPRMPELEGLERFLAAPLRATKESLLDARLEEIVLGAAAGTALDHGCGKGRLALALGRVGLAVTAFDPVLAVDEEIRGVATDVRFIEAPRLPEAVRKEVFDVVVSSLVLCTIEDDDEVATILRELREVCAPGGRIVVAICNPGSVARSTLLQSREPCRTPDVRTRTFKTLRPTGVRRADVHRPLRVMLDLFAHAGLRVRRREETISFDPDTLEPSSDFLIVELEPAGRRRP